MEKLFAITLPMEVNQSLNCPYETQSPGSIYIGGGGRGGQWVENVNLGLQQTQVPRNTSPWFAYFQEL